VTGVQIAVAPLNHSKEDIFPICILIRELLAFYRILPGKSNFILYLERSIRITEACADGRTNV
jgi:hypothetical protein